MTLHSGLPTSGAGVGSASPEAHELLGNEWLPEQPQDCWGRRRGKAEARQLAMFTTQGMLIIIGVWTLLRLHGKPLENFRQ